uniref:Uncharacterized protein n=1 Tax=Anguilla anguilla TaxID=7936 RepID=A0A0E9T1Z3_ANGAN
MVHPSVAKCLLLRLVSLYFNELDHHSKPLEN